MDSCWASDNLATAAGSIEPIQLVRLDNSNSRDVVLGHHCISHFYIFGRSVNGKSFSVSLLDHLNVVIIQNVVGVSVTLTATVSISQLINFGFVNITQRVGQVPSYIVAPQLATAKLANQGSKFCPDHPTLAIGNGLPMYILGATFSVAALIVEGAGGGAGFPAAGASGDGAGFAVAADGGQGDVHCLGVVVGGSLAPR